MRLRVVTVITGATEGLESLLKRTPRTGGPPVAIHA
jgi:hypothetical protein